MSTSGILAVVSYNKPAQDSEQNFDRETKEAHKSRREYLKGGGIEILSHEHYFLDGTAGASPEPTYLDLYELDTIEPFLNGEVLLEEGGEGPMEAVHSYIYRVLSVHGELASQSANEPQDLAYVSLEPPMTTLDEMNRWYEEEHIALLSKVSGWLSTVRGSLVLISSKGEQDTPKYAAFHRYGPNNGLGTSVEWKEATSTEWNKKLRQTIETEGKRTRSQWVFEKTR